MSILLASAYTRTSFATVTTYPFTAMAWVFPFTNSGTILSLNSATAQRVQLDWASGLRVFTSAGSNSSVTAAGGVTNAWQFVCVVGASPDLRQSQIGKVVATDTTALTPAGINTFAVNARYDGSSWGAPSNAYYAHVAMWRTALTKTERDALADGINPLSIRPAQIVGYWTGEDSYFNPFTPTPAWTVAGGSLAWRPQMPPVRPAPFPGLEVFYSIPSGVTFNPAWAMNSNQVLYV